MIFILCFTVVGVCEARCSYISTSRFESIVRTSLSGTLFLRVRTGVDHRGLSVVFEGLVAFLAPLLVDKAFNALSGLIRRKNARVFGIERATSVALGVIQ